MKIQNSGTNFINFYKEIEGSLEKMSEEKIFSLFQNRVSSNSTLYYDIIEKSLKSYQENFTPELYKKHIVNQIRNYSKIKETFEYYNNQIIDIINQGKRKFQQFFPDFKFNTDILIGHSMFCFDGGVRFIENKRFLVFGLDMISSLYKDMSPKPFIIHELFHEYHNPLYQMYKNEGVLLDALWREGLAVYISELIVPGSSNDEILLNNPKGMIELVEQNIVDLSIELENNLELESPELYQKYFLGPLDETRYRAGYYIGYLLVLFVRKEKELTELVRMSGKDIYPFIKEFLTKTKNSFQDLKKYLSAN
jgi:hypothetical protein